MEKRCSSEIFRPFITRLISLVLFFAAFVPGLPAQAAGRFIVRAANGSAIQLVCFLTGCTVAGGIDGSGGKLYVVTTSDALDPVIALTILSNTLGVIGVEPDLIAHTAAKAPAIPPALADNTPITYYGATVPHGYVYQPATQSIRLADLRATYPGATGVGVVAVIDTGVDPNHPVLKPVLLPGYDFTRNRVGADETLDISLLNPPLVNGVQPIWVNSSSGEVDQSTAAVVDQSTAAVVDGPPSADFGHGTMVAGIIHLVAPTAKILPIKVFHADGTGYTSDILRGIYFAMSMHANVLNMSFHLASYSPEVATALTLASLTGTVSVAAAGNDGQECLTYPAALSMVMGVASTTNDDQISTFSNYGPQLVWVAAPGEGVVTTYPFSTYAASWGTSFSTPFVSGLAAAMLSVNPLSNQSTSSGAAAHAQPINPNAGHGRVDALQALRAASPLGFLQ
jgi:subtilisin family serine protease